MTPPKRSSLDQAVICLQSLNMSIESLDRQRALLKFGLLTFVPRGGLWWFVVVVVANALEALRLFDS
jgi:hypothetical protein